MKVRTAVVPVAGWGTRLLPLTQLVAKEFFPLGRKPAIQHIAEELGRAGIERIIFVASARKRQVAQLFAIDDEWATVLANNQSLDLNQMWGHSPFAKMEIELALQEQQLGLGHAVLSARSAVGDESFVLALGDCVIGLPEQSQLLPRMLREHEDRGAEIVISFEEVPRDRVSRYGIAQAGDYGDCFPLQDVVEKPTPQAAPSNLAICGRYVLPATIFSEIENSQPGHGGEIQLTDAIRRMIQRGSPALGVRLNPNEFRYDVGNLKSYVRSFVEFALADPELRSAVEEALECTNGDQGP